jgi:hypothetical protein
LRFGGALLTHPMRFTAKDAKDGKETNLKYSTAEQAAD